MEYNSAGSLTKVLVRGSGYGGGIGSVIYTEDGAGTNRRLFLYNALGSTSALTDDAMAVSSTSSFDGWGTEVATTGTVNETDRKFCTKERSASIGLDYFYDYDLGRFATRDPAGYPDGLNNYLYCNNDPVNKIDPLGLKKKDKLKEELKNLNFKKLFSGLNPKNWFSNAKESLAKTVTPFVKADKKVAKIIGLRVTPLQMADDVFVNMYGNGFLPYIAVSLKHTKMKYGPILDKARKVIPKKVVTQIKKIKVGKVNAPKAKNYGNLRDGKSAGSGKKFTQAQKRNIRQQNMQNNNGKLKSDISGKELTIPKQSQKGITPPSSEAHIDHVFAKSKGGSNS